MILNYVLLGKEVGSKVYEVLEEKYRQNIKNGIKKSNDIIIEDFKGQRKERISININK